MNHVTKLLYFIQNINDKTNFRVDTRISTHNNKLALDLTWLENNIYHVCFDLDNVGRLEYEINKINEFAANEQHYQIKYKDDNINIEQNAHSETMALNIKKELDNKYNINCNLEALL